MSRVPRELFVSPDYHYSAYEDMPLSIGFGQTISQPFIVALMTQALELKGGEKVLELGTGSGYQTAILAGLAKWVVSIERVPQLAESARQVLDKLGYTNVEIHEAGEALGWPDGAPYDAVIVTAGAPRVPDALLEQLALGGRLVIPVGSRWEQDLLRVTRRKKGNVVENLGGCRFVPLIGKGAWEEG
jgi:protein-L-isoaspartate(D-aspartate) O-methyltransferase